MAKAKHTTLPEDTPQVEIRAMHHGDAEHVLDIYQAGIEGNNATFETQAPSWEEWDAKHLSEHRFVALINGEVAGWVAVGPVSSRPAYAGVVEASLYIAPQFHNKGIGSALLRQLLRSTDAAGIWTVQSSVFPENSASLALNAKFGFRVVGRRERIAKHHGIWRDTLLLERRSPTVE